MSKFKIVSLLLLIACQPSEKQLLIENAKKYLPSVEQRQHLAASIEQENQRFDPKYNALKTFTPTTANHYHSTRVGMHNHPVRESSGYAVDLLETKIPENQQRAFKVIEAVLDAQDTNTESDTYGIWPYYFEEPLEQMNRPDWNWADFNSVQLLEAYMKFHEVIPEALLSRMEEALVHASYSIKNRDVKPGYTNIAIMGTLVTHLTGHLFNNQELMDYADMRMERFYQYTKDLGGFAEYNSPTYTRVALNELMRMKQYILDTATLEMVEYCYKTGWRLLSEYFHVPTGQLAGPHSRSYSTVLRDRFYDFLYGASDGKVKFGDSKKPLEYYKLQHRLPSELLVNFLEAPGHRVQTDTFSLEENPPIGYSYLTDDYCFGSVNRSTTWKQRRPYVVYWGDQQDVRFLRVKLMHDQEDFAIGNIFTAQHENESITGMNFATNGGDYHHSIDRLTEGKFTAADVRLRFEMSGSVDSISILEDGFQLHDGDIEVHINMLKAVFGDLEITLEQGNDEGLTWVDYVIYRGEKKEIDLTTIDEACFAWHTAINPTGKSAAELIEAPNQIRIQTELMSLTLPVKPSLEEEQQQSFVIDKKNVQD